MPANTPAELTAIQEQFDEWVERGVVKVRSVSQGAGQQRRIFYRVAHAWELEAPGPDEQKHVHDWRHDMTQQEADKGLIYCGGCDAEVWRDHADFADPRVIRHKGDDLDNY
jgi:hypothetical protein